MERIIGLDMSWLAEGAAHQLISSLLSMRRFETAYILDRNFDDRAGFNAELDKFNKTLDGVVAADILKTQIRQTVRSYADTFETWLVTDREIASR